MTPTQEQIIIKMELDGCIKATDELYEETNPNWELIDNREGIIAILKAKLPTNIDWSLVEHI